MRVTGIHKNEHTTEMVELSGNLPFIKSIIIIMQQSISISGEQNNTLWSKTLTFEWIDY